MVKSTSTTAIPQLSWNTNTNIRHINKRLCTNVLSRDEDKSLSEDTFNPIRITTARLRPNLPNSFFTKIFYAFLAPQIVPHNFNKVISNIYLRTIIYYDGRTTAQMARRSFLAAKTRDPSRVDQVALLPPPSHLHTHVYTWRRKTYPSKRCFFYNFNQLTMDKVQDKETGNAILSSKTLEEELKRRSGIWIICLLLFISLGVDLTGNPLF